MEIRIGFSIYSLLLSGLQISRQNPGYSFINLSYAFAQQARMLATNAHYFVKESTMLDILVLAAGKGTRMRSDLPKVLHPVGGKALVQHVVDTARKVGGEQIMIIVGH